MEPWFESSCCCFEVWKMLFPALFQFTQLCKWVPGCGWNMWVNSMRAVIGAWLNASQRSQVGIGMSSCAVAAWRITIPLPWSLAPSHGVCVMTDVFISSLHSCRLSAKAGVSAKDLPNHSVMLLTQGDSSVFQTRVVKFFFQYFSK